LAVHLFFGKLPSASSVEPGENDKKAVDQTGAENCTDLFRVYVLRGRGLTEEIARIFGDVESAGIPACNPADLS
jgi:hypothetical protein